MPKERHGERRRRQVIAAAVNLSTTDGLESVSFSRIASEVGLTKAGVAAHFDSKQALQLATVEAAAEAYAEPLSFAQNATEPGLARLRALALAWLDHLERISYRGGCFFAAAGHDFGSRPGPVRESLARYTRRFIVALEEQARLAARLGELSAQTTPDALAFSVHALAQEANLRRELLDDTTAFELARVALDELMRGVTATAPEETLS